jgi:hypothetical protein
MSLYNGKTWQEDIVMETEAQEATASLWGVAESIFSWLKYGFSPLLVSISILFLNWKITHWIKTSKGTEWQAVKRATFKLLLLDD